MKKRKYLQQLIAGILCVVMLASLIVMPAVATEETAVSTEQTEQEPLDVIWVASDFQKNETDSLDCVSASQAALQPIVDAMVADGVDKVTGAIFLGDYATGYYNLSNTNNGIYAIHSTLKHAWGIDYEDMLFMQGNHEADYQAYWDHGNDPSYYKVVSGVYNLASSGKHDAENYGVYIINEVDYSWDNIGGVEKVTRTAAALESYLKTKANQSYDKPIFITSHLPLNFSHRTIHSGDAFTGELLFNVINKYAAKGLNIIYLYGHDHNHGFSNYLGGDAIYLTTGDTMLLADTDDASRNTYYVSEPMHFTYLNGGFLGEINGCCDGAKAGVSNQNTSTIFEIYEDRVEITRYDANGVHNMKNAGANSQCSCSNGIYSGENYGANTTVLEGTQTVTLNKAAYSLQLGELSSGLMVNGETATVYLKVQDGNTYAVDWQSSNPEVISVSGNGTEALLTALNPGSVVITVSPTLNLTSATDQLTFQVTVVDDVQNPGELITVVSQGETIYLRQPYQWDDPFVYDNYSYFSVADDNPFLLVREALGYTETYGNRLILGQTEGVPAPTYDNEGIAAQVMAYTFNGFAQPFIKASSVPSNRYKWILAKQETGIVGFGNPINIKNASSGNYLYLTAEDANQYGQDNYGFRFKGDDCSEESQYNGQPIRVNGEYKGAWWRMSSGSSEYNSTGLLGAKGSAESHTLYTLYYSTSKNHFAVTTSTAPSNRIYLYHQDTAPVTVTLQLSDTLGYICKDAPVKISTGDYITLTEGDQVTKIPLTVEMLEGYVDRNTAGTYSNLKVVYKGVTLAEDYTLIVRNSASLMVNDGSDTASSSVYRLATGITEGKKYMIVNSNQPGQAQALGFVEQNDGSDVLEKETESYYVVVEEWTIDGVTDLYVDASNFNGGQYKSGHRMAWFAQKTFNYTTEEGETKSVTSLDGYYYFVNVNTSQYALLNGRSVTSTFEPYNYRWGDDYDTYGLYNNYESDHYGVPRYLNYDAGLLEINKFIVREGSVDSRIYLYEQVPSFALAAGYMSDLEGKVNTQAVGSTITGDALIIETMTIDGTMDTTAIPVTVSMLNATKEQLTTPGTYYNLTVTYHGQVITDDYTLVVEDVILDDYPDYPEEGSVKIDKTLDQSKYTYLATGAASIDLTVTGIPQYSGADVVIVLDTSSSMAFGIDGNEVETEKSRLVLLQESLKRLMLNLQTDVNGEPQDISISIVDFNGYTPIDNTHTPAQFTYTNAFNRTTTSGYSPTGFTNRDVSEVYLPFTDIADMTEAEIDSVLSQITHKSGTNYDRGLQWAYDLLNKKQAQNSLAGEYRRPYVVFMSDGCPFQYNYIVCDGDGVFWEDYLLGHLDEAVAGQTEASQEPHFLATGIRYSSVGEMFSESAADVWEDFYNPEGKHWMAEAIKGDPNTKYKVIDPDIGNVDDDFITEVNGLGATMVTIGLGIYYSGEMEEDDCKEVLRSIATTPSNYYDVYSAEDLDSAFDDFANLVAMADGAVYTDQMSEEFEVLTYNQRTFEKIDGSSVTVTYNPSITLRQNALYKHSEIGKTLSFTDSEGQTTEVQVTEDMVGVRKPVDSVLLEEVIFNDDGSAAYSTQVDLDGDGIFGATVQPDGSCIITDEEDNIFIDRVIYAKEFWYNADAENSATVAIDSNGATATVSPKTFRWNVGIIPQNELILSYDIYLTGSMEGTRPAGYYDTNSHAELDYENYLGHDCQLVAPVPNLLWGQASVGYGFYLVNGEGKPVGDITTYEVCGFADALKVGSLGYDFFYLNAEEQVILASDKYIQQALESQGYILYDSGAGYAVSANSEGGGYYTVTAGKEVSTTYVEGVQDTAVSGTGKTETTDYVSANTVVWFAVRLKPVSKPDTVVVDFGQPIDIHVLVNDLFENKAELVGIGAVPESMEETAELLSNFGANHTGSYGTAIMQGDKVTYTPGNMQMSGTEVFAYAVKFTDGDLLRYFYGTVTVVPATIIYYEDSFVTFSEGDWNPTAGGHTGNQGQDRPGQFEFVDYDTNNIYGFDPVYNASKTHSFGSSQYVRVDSTTYKEKGKWPTAQFTFTGTGFDLISLTSNATGFITCKVYEGTQATGDAKYSWVVDTYYGYTRERNETHPWIKETWTHTGERWAVTTEAVTERGTDTPIPENPTMGTQVILYKENYEWEEATGTANPLYQIPVIKSPELEYKTYTVVITPTYIPFFNHTGTDGYDFYLDAVRVYGPAKNMESYYLQDGEAWPQFIELRQQLLSVDASGNATGYVDGVSFIDSVATDGKISDYSAYGPNNEVYLNAGQSIAFAINSMGQSIANVHVGIKTFNGAGALSVTTLNAAGETLKTATVNTASHTDLYYSITDAYIPVDGSDISNVIVLTNNGSEPITLTTLKITYDSETAIAKENQAKLVMNTALMKAAENEVKLSLKPSPSAERKLMITMGHSVSFESDLRLNYRVKLSELEGYDLDSAYLTVEKDVYLAKGEQDVETYVLYPELTSDRMIFNLEGILSVEMGSELRATLHIQDLQSRSYASAVDQYSILAYAKEAFSRCSYEEQPELYRLLIDTLNYGAAAQTYFDRRTDSLVNAGLDAYQQYATKELTAELTASKVVVENANSGLVSKLVFSVSFADRTELNAKLTLAEAAEITAVKVTDAEGNTVATLTEFTELSDGKLQVTYSGIKATQMRQMFYFTAYAGEEIAGATYGYSVEAYAREAIAADLPGLSDLARACMYYGDSAENYFTQRGGESK